MRKTLQLFPASENFPKLYHKEKNRLTKLLGNKISIEHIGSTAVPGLIGKGIIDLAIGVPKLTDLSLVANKLITAGYFPDLDNKLPADRIFLSSREHGSTFGDYHLHIVVKNDAEWQRLIFFREQLIADDKLKKEYAALKKHLLTVTAADRQKYKKMKNNFIQNVLNKIAFQL